MALKGHVPWNKGKIWSDEIREKISKATKGRVAWNKGIPHTEETRTKIGNTKLGKKRKPFTKETRQKMSVLHTGDKNWRWKGDTVGYKGVHIWVGKILGKPNKCSHCGTSVAKRYEWANKSGKYLRNINDYIRLCVKCHQAFDNRKGGVKKLKEKNE